MLTPQLPILIPATAVTPVWVFPGSGTSSGAFNASGASGGGAGAGAVVGTSSGKQADEVGLLLVRVAAGDVHAFEDLYERTARRVFGLAQRVLVDAEMSAEATQDVFLALWTNGAARFDPARGSGISWVMTLAHRRAVDKVRAEESHRGRDLRWGIKNRGLDHDHVAETVVDRSEAQAVRSCLGSLSALQRQAIELAYYTGMTYTQVAEHLGIPVPTAKSRIRDGINRLRSCLQPPT